MGLFNAMSDFSPKSDLRESKDEIVCGELIRGLSHAGWHCHRIVADSARQVVGFKVPHDEVLSAVYIVVDGRSGAGSPTPGMGGRTVMGFTAQMRNRASDPAELAAKWKADIANLFNMPVAGEVRIDHQLTTVSARTYHVVDLDQYVSTTSVEAEPLVGWVIEQVDALREHLRPLQE